MRIAENNPFAVSSSPFAGRQRALSRDARRNNIIQERLADQRREMQKQENERERINDLLERIDAIEKCEETNPRLKNSLISSLHDKIDQIYAGRTEREKIAVEREMLRQQALLDDMAQIREKPPEEPLHEDPEKIEERQQQSQIFTMTRIAITQDTINNMRNVRANMVREAGHLGRAMGSPNSNYNKIGVIYRGSEVRSDIIINRQSGFGGNDFRNNQLRKLNEGITRLDASIRASIISMYRESVQAQEEHLGTRRQDGEQREPRERPAERADNANKADYSV
jgi:hypothetical protein